MSQVAHLAKTYSSFHRWKRLRVSGPLKVTPSNSSSLFDCSLVPFILLGGWELSVLPKNTTQWPSHVSNPDLGILSQTCHYTTMSLNCPALAKNKINFYKTRIQAGDPQIWSFCHSRSTSYISLCMHNVVYSL